MYSQARKHFKKNDARLYKASLEFELDDLIRTDDLLRDIVWTIVGQQLSGKAADTIFDRFETLFPGKLITPEEILKISEEDMRKSGLSGAKARAIKDLAKKIVDNVVSIEKIPEMEDSKVVEELLKVKGIGPWTAEMILMFSLGRTDVFSKGDLVLRKELMRLRGWKKDPGEKKMAEVLKKWSPYKTYAARILWKLGDMRKPGALRKKYKENYKEK